MNETDRNQRTKLKHLTIGGYCSIKQEQPLDLNFGDVTVLLGPNGAGKSNIVSFFKMLSYMMSRSFASYVEQMGGASTLFHYGPKHTSQILGRLDFQRGGALSTYQCTLQYAVPDRLIISEEQIAYQVSSRDTPYRRTLEPEYKESALASSSDKTAQVIYRMLSSCKAYQFKDSSITGPLRQTVPQQTVNYLQAEGNNLASFLWLLREQYPESYRQIVEHISEVVPDFSDFYLEPQNGFLSLQWRDTSARDYVFNAHQLSDGSLRFIALATLLLQPAELFPSVVIIDEPELGLHPYAIGLLAEMIRRATLHTQVIISTQSSDLADCFELDEIAIIDRDKQTHSTTARNLSKEEYSQWLEEYSTSELWKKNVLGGNPLS